MDLFFFNLKKGREYNDWPLRITMCLLSKFTRSYRSHMDGLVSSPGFILHRYSYSETSLLLKVLMPDLSITPVIAKGVKSSRRGKLALAGLCEPFNYLQISYTGRGEVKSLKNLDLISPMKRLVGDVVSSGFYLNELMIYLLGPVACSEKLFKEYLKAQQSLADLDKNYDFLALSKILRIFEYELLKETGHGPGFSLDHGVFDSPEGLNMSKKIFRDLIDLNTDGRIFRSREMLKDLRDLKDLRKIQG